MSGPAKKRDRLRHVAKYACPRCRARVDWQPPEPCKCDSCGFVTRKPKEVSDE